MVLALQNLYFLLGAALLQGTFVTAASQTCTPTAGNSASTDDVPAIESAIAACTSGTIIIPKGSTYHIGSQLLFTGCAGCTLQIDGTLQMTADFDYWNGKAAFILIKGITDATVTSSTGAGVVDGNGQAYWDYIVNNDTSYSRPNLVRVDGSTGFTMSNLSIRSAPQFHVVTTGNSKNIHYSDITLYSVSSSDNVAHNTDGFDIGPATNVVAENLHITNDDDCVVLKPGASYVTARNITCVGSHGLSIGSLGSSHTANDTVSHSIFEGAVMQDSAKAAGIKIYPAGPDHGTGTVLNVTWKDIACDGCDYAFQVQTCYGEDETYCTANGNTGHVSDVIVQNFTGTTSGNYDDVVANIDCPNDGSCDIKMRDFDVKAPSGKSAVQCANTESDIGVTCSSGASG